MVWSPRGSYLAVCDPEGVALYGGDNMKRKVYFEHRGVIDVGFSPKETYLVTFNGNDGVVKSTENLILWAVEE